MPYLTALSDVAGMIIQYRKDHSSITTDQGIIISDILEMLDDLAASEDKKIAQWIDTMPSDDGMYSDPTDFYYGGTQ